MLHLAPLATALPLPGTPAAPQLPVDCLAAAHAVAPGATILLTTDVVDHTGALLYRVLDRFTRDDHGLRWLPNVGAGPAPVLVIQTTRTAA